MEVTLDFLPRVAAIFMLIFARLGSFVMTMPIIGERSVPARLRLAFALAVTILLYPLLDRYFASASDNPGELVGLLGTEIIIGLCLGVGFRIVMGALQVAGSVIAMQSGLGFVQGIDPTQGVQSALFAGFMSVMAITLIMLADLHHMLIVALFDSYRFFPPGAPLLFDDFARMAVRSMSGAFFVAVQMSAPFLAFGLIFHLGIGVLSRLMPQAQIFFVALPLSIIAAFLLFMSLVALIMNRFLSHFETSAASFLQ